MSAENNPDSQRALPKVERITIKDLHPEIPEIGGVEIVLQRNAKDNRDPNSPLEIGALVPEAAEKAKSKAKEFFNQIFESLGPDQIKTLDILVVAADTKLKTPVPGIESNHKRAVETAESVMAGIKESMDKFSISGNQLLNKTGRPIELSSGRLRDLCMLEDSTEFVEFLKEKYGPGREFWEAFESDAEKETRERMQAEGPNEIATRVEDYLKVVINAINSYHEKHPGRRVIVWAVSHYDSISPFLKKTVPGLEQSDYLPVDHSAGVVINVGKNKEAKTTIQNHSFDLTLTGREKLGN